MDGLGEVHSFQRKRERKAAFRGKTWAEVPSSAGSSRIPEPQPIGQARSARPVLQALDRDRRPHESAVPDATNRTPPPDAGGSPAAASLGLHRENSLCPPRLYSTSASWLNDLAMSRFSVKRHSILRWYEAVNRSQPAQLFSRGWRFLARTRPAGSPPGAVFVVARCPAAHHDFCAPAPETCTCLSRGRPKRGTVAQGRPGAKGTVSDRSAWLSRQCIP